MKLSKEFKLGLFIIIIIGLTFVVLNVLRGTDILGREKTVIGHFDNVESLEGSAPVYIKGYKAGQVKSIEYSPEKDDFVVTCSISKQFAIPQDSRMVIFSTSIMGSKGIKIESGSSAELLADGGELSTGSEADLVSSLSQTAGPLLAKLGSLADSLKYTVSGVNAVLSEENRRQISHSLKRLRSTIDNADKLMSGIGGKSEDIENIISDLKGLSSKLEPIADSVSAAVNNVNVVSGKLAEADLKGVVEKAGSMMESVDNTVRSISAPLDSVLNNLDSLVRAIQANPKKYIKISVF